MITQTQPQTLVRLGNPSFDHGYANGRSWYFHGDIAYHPITWEYVVDFIYNNILESELDPDRDMIIDYIGFVVGWLSGQCIPEEK